MTEHVIFDGRQAPISLQKRCHAHKQGSSEGTRHGQRKRYDNAPALENLSYRVGEAQNNVHLSFRSCLARGPDEAPMMCSGACVSQAVNVAGHRIATDSSVTARKITGHCRRIPRAAVTICDTVHRNQVRNIFHNKIEKPRFHRDSAR